jgi:hypothetical protein
LALLAMSTLIKAQALSTPSWHPHSARNHPAVADAGEEDIGGLDLGRENEEELEEVPLTAAEEEEAEAALETQGEEVRACPDPTTEAAKGPRARFVTGRAVPCVFRTRRRCYRTTNTRRRSRRRRRRRRRKRGSWPTRSTRLRR